MKAVSSFVSSAIHKGTLPVRVISSDGVTTERDEIALN
jgi:hypothetical protein